MKNTKVSKIVNRISFTSGFKKSFIGVKIKNQLKPRIFINPNQTMSNCTVCRLINPPGIVLKTLQSEKRRDLALYSIIKKEKPRFPRIQCTLLDNTFSSVQNSNEKIIFLK